MTDINIEALQARAARHPSNHVSRFEPLIPVVVEALQDAGLTVAKRYTNQLWIEGRWVGKFEHGHQNASGQSRLVIYDGDYGQQYQPNNLPVTPGKFVLAIRNEAEARLFAATIAFTKSAIAAHLAN